MSLHAVTQSTNNIPGHDQYDHMLEHGTWFPWKNSEAMELNICIKRFL